MPHHGSGFGAFGGFGTRSKVDSRTVALPAMDFTGRDPEASASVELPKEIQDMLPPDVRARIQAQDGHKKSAAFPFLKSDEVKDKITPSNRASSGKGKGKATSASVGDPVNMRITATRRSAAVDPSTVQSSGRSRSTGSDTSRLKLSSVVGRPTDASAIKDGTLDKKTMLKLRALKEPITLFGETTKDRQSRLAAVKIARDVQKMSISEGSPTVSAHRVEDAASTRGSATRATSQKTSSGRRTGKNDDEENIYNLRSLTSIKEHQAQSTSKAQHRPLKGVLKHRPPATDTTTESQRMGGAIAGADVIYAPLPQPSSSAGLATTAFGLTVVQPVSTLPATYPSASALPVLSMPPLSSSFSTMLPTNSTKVIPVGDDSSNEASSRHGSHKKHSHRKRQEGEAQSKKRSSASTSRDISKKDRSRHSSQSSKKTRKAKDVPPHYKVLGVSRNATQSQIKAVYKELVSRQSLSAITYQEELR